MPYNKRQILQPILDKIEPNWEIHQFKADNDVETVCIFRKLQGLHHHWQAEEHSSHFELQTARNIVHLSQLIKNILTAKHCAAWRPISLLARSLFRPLDQSQALYRREIELINASILMGQSAHLASSARKHTR